MSRTGEGPALQSMQIMESLDVKALASIGNTALGELKNELIMNRGDCRGYHHR